MCRRMLASPPIRPHPGAPQVTASQMFRGQVPMAHDRNPVADAFTWLADRSGLDGQLPCAGAATSPVRQHQTTLILGGKYSARRAQRRPRGERNQNHWREAPHFGTVIDHHFVQTHVIRIVYGCHTGCAYPDPTARHVLNATHACPWRPNMLRFALTRTTLQDPWISARI